MGNAKNSSGKRVYDDVYSFPQDSQDLADDLWAAYTSLVGTAAQRAALTPGHLRAGMEFRETDTKYTYRHDGTGWVLQTTGLVGRVVRSGTATTFPATYTNISGNTFWTQEVAKGFANYNTGWTVPVTGRYWLSYEIRAAASFLVGLTVNYSGATPTTLILTSTPTAVQGVAAASASAPFKLTAGDVIRPYLLAASGTPAWQASVGHFSIEWAGVD